MRVEQIGAATLYLGDCRQILPAIEAADHVISDPPYEARMQALHAEYKLRRTDGGSQRQALNFDDITDLRAPFLDHVKRINRGWLLAFCNVEGVGAWQDAILARDMKFKTTCIWNKPDATPKLNGQGPALSYECFTTTWCGAGHARWNGGGRRGVFTHQTNNKERTGKHPTEKPASLMREMVALFSSPGELILDPFMGSGTTGVAALQLGRRFIGCELNPVYFEVAVARMRQVEAQPRLFAEPPPRVKQAGLELKQNPKEGVSS
jgi:site-specific DNA-methyltransferase (adenine-specific)